MLYKFPHYLFPSIPQDVKTPSDHLKWWNKQKDIHEAFLCTLRGDSISSYNWQDALPILCDITTYGISRKFMAEHMNFRQMPSNVAAKLLRKLDDVNYYREFCEQQTHNDPIPSIPVNVLELVINNRYDFSTLNRRKAPIRSYLINLILTMAAIDTQLSGEKIRMSRLVMGHLIRELGYHTSRDKSTDSLGWKISKSRIRGVATKLFMAYDMDPIEEEERSLLGSCLWQDVMEVHHEIPDFLPDDLMVAGLHTFTENTSNKHQSRIDKTLTNRPDLNKYAQDYFKCRSVHI